MSELHPEQIHEFDETALTVEVGDPRAYEAALFNLVDSLAERMSRVEYPGRGAEEIVEMYDAQHPDKSIIPVTHKCGYL